MAYTGIIVTEEEMALMAGENVDTTGDTEANHNILAAMAESYLSVLTRENVVDNYSGYNNDYRKILAEWAARFAAVSLIAYNMAGYTSRVEAEDMINIHVSRMRQIQKILEDQKAITFLKS
tara:strand:+ start:478 stop:840 length:363 start_codon:yes stop_codon:yes gene_type:complete